MSDIERPLARIQEMLDDRNRICTESRYDTREQDLVDSKTGEKARYEVVTIRVELVRRLDHE